jgi:hypothetical protein
VLGSSQKVEEILNGEEFCELADEFAVGGDFKKEDPLPESGGEGSTQA